MSDSGTERADAQHPWIGLASFTEDDRSFFAGRGDEIEDLLRLVRRDTLTLLYGVSGLGKTSLVQAGLFPALREENLLPVAIRLDYLEGALPLARQIIDAIIAAAVAARVEAPQPRPDESLWEYFHREGNHFWSARNDLVTPFLAFDQFEELFTLGRETAARMARANAFIVELADLVENRPPGALRDDPARVKEFNFKPAPLKVLLAMREDYLAELDRIRFHFRALGQNRLRLLPMGERQARKVIALGAALLASGVEDRVVNYVAGGTASAPDSATLNVPSGRHPDEIIIAPALLSLVLRELNERRLALGAEAKITADLLDVEQHKIFEAFYYRTLQDFPLGVRLFIEDELLTASGHRNSCALDDALTKPDVTLPILNELVNRRLLAYEDRHTRRVELTHDVLVPVIKSSRDSRLTLEAAAQADRNRAQRAAQRRKQLFLAAACLLAIAMLATIWGGYYGFIREHKSYYSDLAKGDGFVVGVNRLSESQARKLSSSFLLVHKGVTGEGWKLRWKPPFRMVAVDSRLKPTTNHSMGTYLWQRDSETGGDQGQSRAERLGLHTVCQWEFVSNAKGEIIYERALDRDGRMVYGLIYSPGSDRRAGRLARFVGPDGFPQRQRSSAAEYVSIHYDENGWENRVMYRDGKNLPAAGPDGAFGQSLSHNSRGQVTLKLALDADGKNMIDSAGNCGIEVIYNEKGWLMEAHSVGPDLKPMPVKDGWTVFKNDCDDLGRPRRTAYYGLKGEPVLHKDGYHGWSVEYDEHGNQIRHTYLGLDGNPTLLTSGIAMFRSVFNEQGNLTRISYYGVSGEPALHRDGNHAWEVQLDDRGNALATTYLGLDGKPIWVAAGYAALKSTYDSWGRKTRQSFYGADGQPTLHRDGNHAWESNYDERGNESETTYIGMDGKPTVMAQGYAIQRKQYDSDGNELQRTYFDAAGQPALDRESGIHKVFNIYDGRGMLVRKRFRGVRDEPALHKDGNHGWDAQYDERGNQTIATYLGLDEKPILLPAGFATIRSVYDATGKQTRMRLYGVNGEPVSHRDGHHGWELKYDERGRRTESTHFGGDEKPILLADGYATVTWAYNAIDKVTKQAYYGIEREPVLYENSYHGWESEHDERGNEIATTYLGLDSKPVLLPTGFATIKSVYDAIGRQTRMSLYGVNGEPVLHKDGHHGWSLKYDDRGRKIKTTHFGGDEKPILLPNGYATVKWRYNATDKITQQTYYGIQGEPVLYQKSYHGWQSEYDQRGNEIATTYLGLDAKPALLSSGYAIVRGKYDTRDNLIQQTFHGVKGEAVLHKDGYHGWEATYDEFGKQVTKVYIGLDGKRVLGKPR